MAAQRVRQMNLSLRQARSPRLSRNALLALCACCGMLGACAGTPTRQAPAAKPDPGKNEDTLALATDPCAARLDDIGGAFLLYYNARRQLPATLAELAPFVPAGLRLDFTCAADGKPYVYVPTGLVAPGSDRILVLYDASPAHNGYRFGLVLTPQRTGQPMSARVIRFDERVLQAYRRSAPQ